MKHFLLLLIPLLSNCAVLHHVQLGDVDDSKEGRPFDVKVSEMGIDLDEAAYTLKAASRNRHFDDTIDDLNTAYSAFTMGPKTGNPVFDVTYAEPIIDLIAKECPSGRISNLQSIREMRKYPIISGEIVKVTGTCFKK